MCVYIYIHAYGHTCAYILYMYLFFLSVVPSSLYHPYVAQCLWHHAHHATSPHEGKIMLLALIWSMGMASTAITLYIFVYVFMCIYAYIYTCLLARIVHIYKHKYMGKLYTSINIWEHKSPGMPPRGMLPVKTMHCPTHAFVICEPEEVSGRTSFKQLVWELQEHLRSPVGPLPCNVLVCTLHGLF